MHQVGLATLVVAVNVEPTANLVEDTALITGRVAREPSVLNRYGGL
jgi:hypothetical protein